MRTIFRNSNMHFWAVLVCLCLYNVNRLDIHIEMSSMQVDDVERRHSTFFPPLCRRRPEYNVQYCCQLVQVVRAFETFETGEAPSINSEHSRTFLCFSPGNQNSGFIDVFRPQIQQLRDLKIGKIHVIILVFDFSDSKEVSVHS